VCSVSAGAAACPRCKDWLTGRLEAHLELEHYLEALIRKPGALPGATALEQARAAAGTRVNNVRRERT